MKLFGQLTKPQFYLYCFVYYCVLAVYFYGVKILLHGADLFEMPRPLEYLLGLILFFATAFLATRVDLLWLSYRTHLSLFNPRGFETPQPKSRFYLKVFGYYLFLVTVSGFLFAIRDNLHFMVFYYLLFLAGTIAMANFDYLFPSYQRYQRALSQGQWGITGRFGKQA